MDKATMRDRKRNIFIREQLSATSVVNKMRKKYFIFKMVQTCAIDIIDRD